MEKKEREKLSCNKDRKNWATVLGSFRNSLTRGFKTSLDKHLSEIV